VDKISKEDKEDIVLQLEVLKKSGIGMYILPLRLRATDGKKKKVEIKIYDQDFKDAARPIYLKTKKILDRVVDKVGGNSTKGKLILVGGSTKSEAIREFLRKDYKNLEIFYGLNADESVALGAAVVAKKEVYGTGAVKIFDVLPVAIGVASEGMMDILIPKDSRIPCRNTISFKTLKDNQTTVRIRVLQGNSRFLDECESLGDIVFDNIKPGPAGSFNGTIIQKIDSNGYLTCEVQTPAGDKKVELINVFRSSTQEKVPVAKEDKSLARWRQFADTLEKAKSEALHLVLDDYEAGNVSKEEVATTIRELSKALKGVTVQIADSSYTPEE
jgi:molecular chaperone DnaK (HSP70)